DPGRNIQRRDQRNELCWDNERNVGHNDQSMKRLLPLVLVLLVGNSAAAANRKPQVASISPTSTIAGSGQFTLTVNDTNGTFISSSTVNWNGSTLTATFVSPTQITAIVPAANVATPGTASITVVNPSPGGGTSNALTFTINPP